CEIESIRRRRYTEISTRALVREAQSVEYRGDRRIGDLDAQETLHTRGSHANGIAPWPRALHIAARPRAAAANLDDELRRALDRSLAAAEVDATLESVSRVAHETQA